MTVTNSDRIENSTRNTANITKLAALPKKRNEKQTTPETSLPLKKRRKIIMKP